VTDIMQFGSFFAPLIQLLRPPNTTDGDLRRFWALLQAAIERGDSANWARHVFVERLDDAAPTQLLVGLVLDDEVVPEASNFSLARALRVPHVRPVIREIGTLDDAGDTPVSGNLSSGGTVGLFQFDWIDDGDGLETATHNNIGDSDVGADAWGQFLFDYYESGVGTIVNPYERLGIDRP